MSDLDIFFDTKQPTGTNPAPASPSQGSPLPVSAEVLPAGSSTAQVPLAQEAAELPRPLPPLIVTRSKNSPATLTLSFEGAQTIPAVPVAEQTPVAPTVPVAEQIPVAPTVEQVPVAPTVEQAPALPVAGQIPFTPVTPVTPVVETEQPAQPSPATPKKKRKNSSARRKKPSFRRLMLTGLRDALIAFALLAILLQFFAPTVVHEHSMEDTLKENDVLYIAKQAYRLGEPQYGDIVVFHTALEANNSSEKSLVKRIIGLPGDRITIGGGVVFRNGEALQETYLKSGQTPGEMSEVVVPPDSYFVLGDNREVSNDSRNSVIGCISKQQLQGKALFRIFPLTDFHVF